MKKIVIPILTVGLLVGAACETRLYLSTHPKDNRSFISCDVFHPIKSVELNNEYNNLIKKTDVDSSQYFENMVEVCQSFFKKMDEKAGNYRPNFDSYSGHITEIVVNETTLPIINKIDNLKKNILQFRNSSSFMSLEDISSGLKDYENELNTLETELQESINHCSLFEHDIINYPNLKNLQTKKLLELDIRINRWINFSKGLENVNNDKRDKLISCLNSLYPAVKKAINKDNDNLIEEDNFEVLQVALGDPGTIKGGRCFSALSKDVIITGDPKLKMSDDESTNRLLISMINLITDHGSSPGKKSGDEDSIIKTRIQKYLSQE